MMAVWVVVVVLGIGAAAAAYAARRHADDVEPSVREFTEFRDAISRAQLEPARYGADPVAVNLVWLVEHMTVKGKQRG